jgi:Fe2+ transport system protein B
MRTTGAACPVTLTPEQSRKRGMAWVAGAFLICPCHLPLTLGAAGALLSGTAAGALLTGHPYIAGVVISITWLAATAHGFRHFRAAERQS